MTDCEVRNPRHDDDPEKKPRTLYFTTGSLSSRETRTGTLTIDNSNDDIDYSGFARAVYDEIRRRTQGREWP